MLTRARRSGVVAAGGALALTLAACGGGDEAEASGEGRLAELQEDGTITVGFAGEAPYSFEDDSGEVERVRVVFAGLAGLALDPKRSLRLIDDRIQALS